MVLVKLTIDPEQPESRIMTTEAYPVVRETEKGFFVSRPVYKAGKLRFEIETAYIPKKTMRYVQRGRRGRFCRVCYWLTESEDMREIKNSIQMETAVLRIVDQIRAELQSVANVLFRIEGEAWERT